MYARRVFALHQRRPRQRRHARRPVQVPVRRPHPHRRQRLRVGREGDSYLAAADLQAALSIGGGSAAASRQGRRRHLPCNERPRASKRYSRLLLRSARHRLEHLVATIRGDMLSLGQSPTWRRRRAPPRPALRPPSSRSRCSSISATDTCLECLDRQATEYDARNRGRRAQVCCDHASYLGSPATRLTFKTRSRCHRLVRVLRHRLAARSPVRAE